MRSTPRGGEGTDRSRSLYPATVAAEHVHALDRRVTERRAVEPRDRTHVDGNHRTHPGPVLSLRKRRKWIVGASVERCPHIAQPMEPELDPSLVSQCAILERPDEQSVEPAVRIPVDATHDERRPAPALDLEPVPRALARRVTAVDALGDDPLEIQCVDLLEEFGSAANDVIRVADARVGVADRRAERETGWRAPACRASPCSRYRQ